MNGNAVRVVLWGVEGSDVKPYYIDMEYPDANGTMIKLSDVVTNPKNKYVYIDF
jgi:hypothetical protein